MGVKTFTSEPKSTLECCVGFAKTKPLSRSADLNESAVVRVVCAHTFLAAAAARILPCIIGHPRTEKERESEIGLGLCCPFRFQTALPLNRLFSRPTAYLLMPCHGCGIHFISSQCSPLNTINI